MADARAKVAAEQEAYPLNARQVQSLSGEVALDGGSTTEAMRGFLRNPCRNARGSSSMRAGAVLSLQRSHGNRAALRSVQRDIWDLLKGGKAGDWEIKPPTWKGETDDKYDTPENRRRAEQQEADERGYSPTPNEWWKEKPYDPKAPLPWMPKIKEKEPVEPIIIPPKPPDEKGDYPIPPWPEDEGYA